MPLVHLLEGMFLDHWPEGFREPDAWTRENAFVFPWETTEKRLAEATADEHGRTRVELGAPAMDTTALHMERLASSQASAPLRTTANQIIAVVKGSGRSTVEGRTFEWRRGDVIAVPAWHSYAHRGDGESVLFHVADAPAHRNLGFLREEVTTASTP